VNIPVLEGVIARRILLNFRIEFDCGLIMKYVRHEWHELAGVPDLSSTAVV